MFSVPSITKLLGSWEIDINRLERGMIISLTKMLRYLGDPF
jgi:hypothetical protein